MHNVSQWQNLRHLAEGLGGAVGLLEAVSSKEASKNKTKNVHAQRRLKEIIH